MAEVITYLDPDATGAGDGSSWTDAYTSLSAWEAAEATNLVTAGDWHHLYYRSSAGTADNTQVLINGFTTGVSNYVLIEAASGDEALKTGWSTSRYRFDGAILYQRLPYCYIDGMQIAGPQWGAGVIINYATAGPQRYINCRFSGRNNNTEPVECDDSDVDLEVYTSIFDIDGGSVDMALQVINSNSAEIFNNLIYGWSDGISVSGNSNSVSIKNNIIFNCTDDINDSDTSTIDYNASDDGDGTNSISPSGSNWGNEITDATNGDFTLKSSGNCEDGGTDDPSSGTFSTDIEGDSYSSPWDVGPDAITGGAPTGYPRTAVFGHPLFGALGGPI